MLKNITLDRPLVVLDLETTGTDTKNDRIVEISIVTIQPDGGHKTATMRINPEMSIPAEATAVHGITDADVVAKPTFTRAAAKLAAALDGCDLCGFNLLKFDLKLLVAEFQRAETPFALHGRRFIDPCVIYHKCEPRSLTAALKHYCDRDHDGAHGAEADVMATVAVLDAQVIHYEDMPRTNAELHDFCRDPASLDIEGKFVRRADGVVVFNFSNDHKGRPVDDVASTHPGFLRWMLGKDFMDDAKAIATDALTRVGQPTTHAYTH
jgi:DNA polymerase-3 subunit epsilon